MHLLQSGVDLSVIALWLGHENPTTTHHYVEADLAMKDRALARLQEPDRVGRDAALGELNIDLDGCLHCQCQALGHVVPRHRLTVPVGQHSGGGPELRRFPLPC